MPKMELEVSEEEYAVITDIWNHNKKVMSEEVLRQLGWTDLATFAGDLMAWGFEAAAKDPRMFISQMRERKAPIFKEMGPGGVSRPQKAEDDSLKAYV